jgi:hypothetical protein
MASAIPDLWPDIEQSQAIPPVAILREQAAALGRKTNHLLDGRVDTITTPQGWFKHSFYIVAPALDNYTYSLFWIEHGVDQYPVQAPKNPDIAALTDTTTIVTIGSERELLEYIRNVLNSDKTKRVVGSLLAQVKAIGPTPAPRPW